MTAFVFALCAPRAEAALKREIAGRGLPWAPGYQRPGFVTFRVAEAPADRWAPLPELVFARERSWSVGKVALPADAAAVTAQVGAPPGARWRVSAASPDHAEVAAALARALAISPTDAPPSPGQPVVEVVVTTADEAWIGVHTHDDTHAANAGGAWPEPADVPSRAYAKLDAVLAWWGEAPRAGERALELGVSPGGAAWLLLERGLAVVGVDPAECDPRVAAHPAFTHVRASINTLDPSTLPAPVDWLLADMNVKPALTLKSAARVLQALPARPRALVLTLKLEDYALVDRVPEWVARVRGWGYPEVRARQLAPHRRELAVVARLTDPPTDRRTI